jgi:hypothetical protein
MWTCATELFERGVAVAGKRMRETTMEMGKVVERDNPSKKVMRDSDN